MLLGSSPETLEKYFDVLEETIDQNVLSHNPCLVFYYDGPGFSLNP